VRLSKVLDDVAIEVARLEEAPGEAIVLPVGALSNRDKLFDENKGAAAA
jgi:hypothetical protein